MIPGIKSHPAHFHREEELLLLFSGVIEIVISGKESPEKNQIIKLKKDWIALYPANSKHAIRSISEHSAKYFVIKWSTGLLKNSNLPFRYFNLDGDEAHKKDKLSLQTHLVFKEPTSYLKKLECTVSLLLPGASYKPNNYSNDIVIIVIDGEMEISGKPVKPHDVIYCEKGSAHVIYNKGNIIARFIVFGLYLEYTFLDIIMNFIITVYKKIFDFSRLKRKIKMLITGK